VPTASGRVPRRSQGRDGPRSKAVKVLNGALERSWPLQNQVVTGAQPEGEEPREPGPPSPRSGKSFESISASSL